MLVYEAKLQGTKDQYPQLDRALQTGLFVRNKALRYWMDGPGKSKADLNKYCRVLAKEYPWAKKLKSMVRQAMAKQAWLAVSRFYNNCQQKVKGNKKGFPQLKRLQNRASVEYKTSSWKLSDCRRYLTFTDGFEAVTFKLWGTRDLHFEWLSQIKGVRVVRRADGYYAKAKLRLGRKHLKVQRQRKDWAVKLVRCAVMSADVEVYEDLQIKNLVKNHKLARSIFDEAWDRFRQWVEYFGKVFGVATVAVPPQYTSQKCSCCGNLVKKSLSTHTHLCQCGTVFDPRSQRSYQHFGTRATYCRAYRNLRLWRGDRYSSSGDRGRASHLAEAGNSIGDDGIPLLSAAKGGEDVKG
jgi:putative transposase